MKLGKRLSAIENLVTDQYTQIWDCCCDHGLLGASLLARQAAQVVHFVDILPELMNEVERKLQQFHPKKINTASASVWEVHCQDVATLTIPKQTGKHLIIIAGIGGDLMADLIAAINQKNSDVEIDYLLCPVHHQFTLRETLIDLGFALIEEQLVKENKRFYELLLVANKPPLSSNTITPVGERIWTTTSPEQKQIAADYLAKTISHYQRSMLNSSQEIEPIINAYQAITIR